MFIFLFIYLCIVDIDVVIITDSSRVSSVLNMLE